ncbi:MULTISPECIES: WhiB family transcriptional regulator [Actinoalloteichus]|uniref:Transcriptional regulator WhiB n=1 Tax=Actinoalloteichus fjordicus TaxID=1612552 RepID=A0AAC9LHY5_9PSEU|nr:MULTISPECIES: WhiB family transcriptional regulator [Actinoalloteichus]APU16705.1 Transcription factor WhiB [Actinoalloteichus fjordicus]APU22771.1 Transcription factor WhiB [Actinoalloteichus sp. GBA129-24]
MAETGRLPTPVTEHWDWQLDGACRGANSRLFFHPESERGHAREKRESRAKAICRSCPVLTQCREYALTSQEAYGVWGAMGEGERRELLKSRRRELRMAL